MTDKVRIIVIDGPDMAGKSSMVDWLVDSSPIMKKFKYNKQVDGNLFKINTDSDFEILKMTLPLLDPRFVYVVDRFYFSNMVYDNILRGHKALPSIKFRKWLKDNLDVLEVILTRNEVISDFEDDNLSVSMEKFNKIIASYRDICADINTSFLTVNESNNTVTVDPHERTLIRNKLSLFANRK